MGSVKKQTAEKIQEQELEIAIAAIELHYNLHPELESRYGKAGREKYLQDARYHLSYLAESILADSQTLFKNYVSWAHEMLFSRNIPARDLSINLNCIKEILAQRLPIENYIIAAKYMNGALLQLQGQVICQESYLKEDAPLSRLANKYLEHLLKGDRAAASQLILDKVDGGISVKEIYLYVFQPVQYEIGRLWQQDKLTVAQEHYCTAATQLIMSQLYAHISGSGKNGFKLVATCIAGDLHEVGLRMVTDFFEMEGWDTYYLGANTPLAGILHTLRARKPHLLLVSATMAYHVRAITELISAIRADEALKELKIMVGGCPFNAAPELWKEIGADAFAQDATGALDTAAAIQTAYTKAI